MKLAKTFMLISILGAVALLASACAPDDSAEAAKNQSPYRGLWISKGEADDLRALSATSYCEGTKGRTLNPRTALLIDKHGAVYSYNPVRSKIASAAELEQSKLGVVNKKGEVALTNYKINDGIKIARFSYSPSRQIIMASFTLSDESNFDDVYVESTEEEMLIRTSRQARCKQ